MFLADAALGFVARPVPRMIVFLVGIPFQIAAKMALLVVTAAVYSSRFLLQASRGDPQRLRVLRGM
jgi:flagellar biosynthesis protein FliR